MTNTRQLTTELCSRIRKLQLCKVFSSVISSTDAGILIINSSDISSARTLDSCIPKLEGDMERPAREEDIGIILKDEIFNSEKACTNSQSASQASTHLRPASSYKDFGNGDRFPENISLPIMNTHYNRPYDGSITADPPRRDITEVSAAYSSYWSQMMVWNDWHHRRGQAILAGCDVSSWKIPDIPAQSRQNYWAVQYDIHGAHTRPYGAVRDSQNYYMSDNSQEPSVAELEMGNNLNLEKELEQTRSSLSLHSMLSYRSHTRLNNALQGMTLDVVEEGTGIKLAQEVPKKMLVLFCGRQNVSRFLRTLEREDNENWVGLPVKQEMVIPQEKANAVGFTILISWMRRACSSESRGRMAPIHIPHNLFAAISLVRVLNLLGLDSDAARVDMKVRHVHFARPLSIDDVRSVWKGYPKRSKYVNRLIIEIRNRLALDPERRRQMLRGVEEIEAYVEEVPELFSRVYDQDNDGVHLSLLPLTTSCEEGHVSEEERNVASNDKARKAKILRILPENEG
ncbi:hypothetical protein DM02DRAFT_703576 [Periconia macrospinosa]|uniref:Uncharacterized protein n=1 Tax=Periconia macrospinosa TaxID=97972 RepID=A0A2V1DV58_9PLEO|nr:hypothetical protein DM02DRAFT_703576 [Periconia macrospinosa]